MEEKQEIIDKAIFELRMGMGNGVLDIRKVLGILESSKNTVLP